MSARTSTHRTWLVLLSTAAVLALGVFVGGSGCPTDDDDDATGDDDVSGDDDSGDDDTTVEPFSIDGEVFITPVFYEQDDDGTWVRNELEWTDIDEDGYPYGKIYVATTANFESVNAPLFYDVPPLVPADPKNTGTPYSMSALSWPLDSVVVMAIADTWNDDIISGWDAIAFHPDPIDTTGDPVVGVDVSIDLEFIWCDRWVQGHHGSSCGGGGSHPTVDISGQLLLHNAVHEGVSGDSVVAVYSETGAGPYQVARPGVLDSENEDEYLPWELAVYADWSAQILGAWDWNNNDLFEPHDEWGITVDGVGGDPIMSWAFGTEDISDMLIRIPEDAASPLPSPYVRISGAVNTDGSFAFADLDDDDALVVMASKNEEIEGDTLAEIIASGQLWSYALIPGINGMGDTIPFEVWGKPYTTAYLLAGIDVGGDGNFASDPQPAIEVVHLQGAEVSRNITLTEGP